MDELPPRLKAAKRGTDDDRRGRKRRLKAREDDESARRRKRKACQKEIKSKRRGAERRRMKRSKKSEKEVKKCIIGLAVKVLPLKCSGNMTYHPTVTLKQGREFEWAKTKDSLVEKALNFVDIPSWTDDSIDPMILKAKAKRLLEDHGHVDVEHLVPPEQAETTELMDEEESGEGDDENGWNVQILFEKEPTLERSLELVDQIVSSMDLDDDDGDHGELCDDNQEQRARKAARQRQFNAFFGIQSPPELGPAVSEEFFECLGTQENNLRRLARGLLEHESTERSSIQYARYHYKVRHPVGSGHTSAASLMWKTKEGQHFELTYERDSEYCELWD